MSTVTENEILKNQNKIIAVEKSLKIFCCLFIFMNEAFKGQFIQFL